MLLLDEIKCIDLEAGKIFGRTELSYFWHDLKLSCMPARECVCRKRSFVFVMTSFFHSTARGEHTQTFVSLTSISVFLRHRNTWKRRGHVWPPDGGSDSWITARVVSWKRTCNTEGDRHQTSLFKGKLTFSSVHSLIVQMVSLQSVTPPNCILKPTPICVLERGSIKTKGRRYVYRSAAYFHIDKLHNPFNV